jgi:hypothetical protein
MNNSEADYPTSEGIFRMMQRMHTAASNDMARNGNTAGSAKHDQIATKFRNAADDVAGDTK